MEYLKFVNWAHWTDKIPIKKLLELMVETIILKSVDIFRIPTFDGSRFHWGYVIREIEITDFISTLSRLEIS